MSADILVQTENHICQIQLHRPDKKHALTHAMYGGLASAIQAADEDPAVRVIYLTGTEGCFTAGNDMGEFLNDPPAGPEAPVFRLLETAMRARKPIVAAVSGIAVGIGTTILLHCDLIYCDDTARFRLPFVNLGLCPEAGSSLLLPLLAGYPRAAELLLLGDVFDAAKAREIGLVNAVLPAAELQAYALGRAQQLAAQPAASVRLSKQLMKQNLLTVLPALMREEGDQFIQRLSSPEAREAMGAFVEKRKPDFSRFE